MGTAIQNRGKREAIFRSPLTLPSFLNLASHLQRNVCILITLGNLAPGV